ncbi:ABC transporter permease subunit [candidate division WOR-3 bacterium]|nr:ABC transporter permease subunit [candidate division WOR-3 bacterium]
MNIPYSFQIVFKMFFKPGLRRTRTKVLILLNVFPLLIVCAVKFAGFMRGEPFSFDVSFFSGFAYIFYIGFYCGIVAVFYGTSVIREDIEDKTLVFLTSRPVPKKDVFLGKYLSYLSICLIAVLPAFTLCFAVVFFNRLLEPLSYLILFKFSAGIILAILAYYSLFAFLSLIASKSTALGLAFIFGWEGIVQYFPGSTQKLTVIYHVKAILPPLREEGGFFSERLAPENPFVALAVILILVSVSVLLSVVVFRKKRYIL